jgi:NADH:ubiquinone oxidoreductase subunit K
LGHVFKPSKSSCNNNFYLIIICCGVNLQLTFASFILNGLVGNVLALFVLSTAAAESVIEFSILVGYIIKFVAIFQ